MRHWHRYLCAARAAVWAVTALAVVACGGATTSTSGPVQPKVIGARGTTPGLFSFPRGIDVARDGRIAVADKTGRIQVLSPEGQPLAVWTLEKIDNGTPTGLIFDQSDPATTTLLIADTHNSRILRTSLDGALLDTYGTYGDGPGQMIYPTDIALDAKGNLYLTEYGKRDRVIQLDPKGQFSTEWGDFGPEPGHFQRPLALAMTPDDRLIVADTCNHRLEVFTADGQLQAVWGEAGEGLGQFNYPYDLAVGPGGDVWVAEYGNHRVQHLSAQGKPLAVYGKAGAEPGRFASPWGIALTPQGQIIVADTNNHRLQILSPSFFQPETPAP